MSRPRKPPSTIVPPPLPCVHQRLDLFDGGWCASTRRTEKLVLRAWETAYNRGKSWYSAAMMEIIWRRRHISDFTAIVRASVHPASGDCSSSRVLLHVVCVRVWVCVCRVDGDSFLDRVKGVYSKSRNGEVDAGNEFNWRAWGVSQAMLTSRKALYAFSLDSKKARQQRTDLNDLLSRVAAVFVDENFGIHSAVRPGPAACIAGTATSDL